MTINKICGSFFSGVFHAKAKLQAIRKAEIIHSRQEIETSFSPRVDFSFLCFPIDLLCWFMLEYLPPTKRIEKTSQTTFIWVGRRFVELAFTCVAKREKQLPRPLHDVTLLKGHSEWNAIPHAVCVERVRLVVVLAVNGVSRDFFFLSQIHFALERKLRPRWEFQQRLMGFSVEVNRSAFTGFNFALWSNGYSKISRKTRVGGEAISWKRNQKPTTCPSTFVKMWTHMELKHEAFILNGI